MQDENSQLHNYVYSGEMVKLVTSANEFCQFLEQIKGVSGKAFISRSVQLLANVYAAILNVTDTEPVSDSDTEPTVTEQDWSMLFQNIAILLGAHNEIFRQAEEDEFDRFDMVSHTISEDMVDVYQELRDFTTIYSRGLEELINDAAWELKERFKEHWGLKLVRSMTALHNLYVNGIDPMEKA